MTPATRGSERGPNGYSGIVLGEGLLQMTKPVDRVLAADLAAPSRARGLLRDWLDQQQWPTIELDDLILAASEAVSNAVDHAYPAGGGDVEIGAHTEILADGTRQVVVEVRDQGVWRPQPEWHENRRRGLQLMRACTADLTVLTGAQGTLVRMTSRAVPVEPRGNELAQS
jgi:anti-sigma regulatory factor (Ser/Thr protein kinase)